MSDSFVIDEGNCKNRYVPDIKFGKVPMYPLRDTMNSDKTALISTNMVLNELNMMTNKYVKEVEKNKKMKKILEDLNINPEYYYNEKSISPNNHPSKTHVNFTIYENMDYVIMEMICTLKNLGGEYSHCKSRLRKIYGAILNSISGGEIKVKTIDSHNKFNTRISCSANYSKYNVDKNWEKDCLLNDRHFKTPHYPSKKPKRSISGRVRQNVFMRDNYTCQICGKTIDDGVTLHLDHIQPVSKGGSDEEDNLQVLCSQCNLEKHNRTDLLHDKRKLKQLNG